MASPIITRRIHPNLPIFLLEVPEGGVLYSPGNVAPLAAGEIERVVEAFRKGDDIAEGSRFLVEEFTRLGALADQAWKDRRDGDFTPSCLTVYLSNACNLGCSYCFAANGKGERIQPGNRDGELPVLHSLSGLPQVDEQKVYAAAQFVARSCQQQQKPFQLVVHGGGEPTLHWNLLQRVVATSKEIARSHGVEWTSYLATHGAIDRDKAVWLGENFQRIGVSCDGPPDIHDAQRYKASGSGTFANVAETIRVLRDSPASVTLRATITRTTMKRQAEIVVFLVSEFGARDIRFEPVYLSHGRAELAFRPEDAIDFASHFLAAQRVADRLHCQLRLSGVRLDEIHGPYCNVLRDVIQITPDNSASACFLVTDARAPGGAEMMIGAFDPESSEFELDYDRIRRMRRQASQIPDRCQQCVNVYHCARDCPDVCPVADHGSAEAPGFRCLVQKELGQRWIVAAALGNNAGEKEPVDDETFAELNRIHRALRILPPRVDADAIVRQWQQARRYDRFEARTMPAPPWSTGGYRDSGEQAWQFLASQLTQSNSTSDQLSCYIHLPYCDRKCMFCDCYAQLLPAGEDHKQRKYIQTLIDELRAWGQFDAITRRPVTTVHFGGGTPSYVPPAEFERLLMALRSTLHCPDSTEWALETTSSQLTRAYLDQLREWGVSRLHVGIQTLEDTIRTVIGRKEDGRTALEKVSQALEAGFVVSVDLIYGLPGQTLQQFVADIDTLVSLGVDGMSLYHFNTSRRNQVFSHKHDCARRPAFEDYLRFQFGEAILSASGFVKRYFSHFARERDLNKYYGHVVRGEDLLALGTTADGSFDGYIYRHPPIGEYLAETTISHPALEGGLLEGAEEISLRPFMAGILNGAVSEPMFQECGIVDLRERWVQFGMLESDEKPGWWRLTANGSWYVSRLLDELRVAASGVRTERIGI